MLLIWNPTDTCVLPWLPDFPSGVKLQLPTMATWLPLPFSVAFEHSLMKVSEIVSQMYYLKANPYVLAWFMGSPIENSSISSNIPKGRNFGWWQKIGVGGKISKRWIYKWRLKVNQKRKMPIFQKVNYWYIFFHYIFWFRASISPN